MSTQSQLCRECGTMVAVDRDTCPNCGAELTLSETTASSSHQSGTKVKSGCLWVLGILVGLTVLGGLVGEPDGDSGDRSSEISDENTQSLSASEPEPTNVDEAAEFEISADQQPTARLSGPQFNAQRSARQYLNMSGFSRAGLIEQLSSAYGDGYSVPDATAAVDSLNVNWNRQAERSARQYLDMMGFSCSGLIEQLSSSAGDRYTLSEARHGAQAAGAC